MSRRPALDSLILKIHAAVLESESWAPVVRDLASVLKADSALLLSVPSPGNESFWVPHNIEASMLRHYAADFIQHDAWLLGARRTGRDTTGTVSVDDQLVGRREFLNSIFYNDLCISNRMDRMINLCLEGSLHPGAAPERALSFYREPGKAGFSSQEHEALTILSPHLVLATRNMLRARALSVRNSMYAQSLDQITTALYAIDALGRLVFANRCAERALTRSQWLAGHQGVLRPSASVREAAAVTEALRQLRKGIAATVLLSDPSGRESILMTAPLAPSDRLLPGPQAIGIVWLVPLKADSVPLRQLSKLFVLSTAEQRLLSLLVRGDDLHTAADALGVSWHTVRVQLKSIFRKTGRRSQADLMALVHRMAAIQVD